MPASVNISSEEAELPCAAKRSPISPAARAGELPIDLLPEKQIHTEKTPLEPLGAAI
jgi:hypothetical protein